MNTSQYEPLVLKYLMNDSQMYNLVKHEYFDNEDCKTIFRFFSQYKAKDYGNPSCIQLHEFIKSHEKYRQFSKNKLEIIYDLNISETGYADGWVKEQAENWVRVKNIESRLSKAVEYINSVDMDIDNSKQVFNTVNDILVQGKNLSFDFQSGLDFFDISTHIEHKAEYYPTGFDFLDTTIGGWSKGTLHVFAGPPKIGKTLTLGSVAAQSVRAGNNTYIITLELSGAKYAKRLGSDLFNIKISDYDEVVEQPFFKDQMAKSALKLAHRGEFIIKDFPTSTLTVPQLEAHLLREESLLGIKFKTIIIDYLNLLCNHRNPNTENTYMKIKQLAEDLRAMAQRNGWCIITGTQTKRDNYGQPDIKMGDIAESAGLIHTIDSLIGLIQTPTMYGLGQYEWKILCNRDGGYKNAKKLFMVDYRYMRLWEDMESDILEDDGI